MAPRWMKKIVSASLLTSATSQQNILTHHRQDISESCFNAISAAADGCPSGLLVDSLTNFHDHWRESLDQLCALPCRESLIDHHARIQSACVVNADVLEVRGIKYPATLYIDRSLYYQGVSCLKDPNTGEFCATSDRHRWDEPDFDDTGELCTDCRLENWKVHLESPCGFSEDLAQEFDSATSRCKATLYDLVTPSIYTLSTPTAKAFYNDEGKSTNKCTEWDPTEEGNSYDQCNPDTWEKETPSSRRASLPWADL